MPRAIALVDLDDSLFQTRRKCPPGLAESDMHVMAVDRSGNPLSFATPAQKAWIDWLSADTLLVPVTARSIDALSRVSLVFNYAVAAHGGVLLRAGGAICPDWHGRMANAARACFPQLNSLADRFAVAALARAQGVRVRIIGELGIGFYVVAKHEEPTQEADLHNLLDDLRSEVPADWTIHVNGNNVAMLPPFLGKEHAVAHLLGELREQHPGLPVLGLGDSLTDAPFLTQCDFIMMPGASQLARHAFEGLLKP